jgi:effector-binding domain-containing protein
VRFSIGEFSRMTSLSIKSLRLYHERGILVPDEVDAFTGYRYYNGANYETARAVQILRQFDFTLSEIKNILDEVDDESGLLEQLVRKKCEIREKIDRYEAVCRSMETLIQFEKERAMKTQLQFNIEEKEIDTVLVAGMRMKGKYEDIGEGFGRLAKSVGRHINGKAMTLYYDCEYKEEGADFEVAFPVRKGKNGSGVSVRELPGGKAVTLIHKGPYDTLGDSYKKLFATIHEKGYKTNLPTREIYIKGPGMIFKGNPENYLTEIVVMLGN